MARRYARNGQRFSNVVKAANSLAGFYSSASDPPWLVRHDGGGSTKGPFDALPVNPGIFIHPVMRPFQTALDVDTTNVWIEAASGSGTGLTVQDARGGKAKFTNGAVDNNYYTYFTRKEPAGLVSGKDLYFLTTIAIADVSEADLFVGLCANLGSGNLFDNRVDAIGFYMTDSDATLFAECNKDGTPTQATTSIDLADGVEKTLVFHVCSTTKVEFFVGNSVNKLQHVVTIPTNLPDNETLAIAFGLRNGTGSANNLTISTIHVPQDM